jgi:hypothetical protein
VLLSVLLSLFFLSTGDVSYMAFHGVSKAAMARQGVVVVGADDTSTVAVKNTFSR